MKENLLMVIVWLLCALVVVTEAFELISAPSTAGVVKGCVLLIVFGIVTWITKFFTSIQIRINVVSKVVISLITLGTLTSCMEKIDAGCEGIKVNLYGSDKGVDDVTLVTGAVWYLPWTTDVFEYPTYVQTVDYQPFTINAKDGSEFTVDPTVSLKVVDGKSPQIFKKYRKELKDVINTTLYNYVKDAFRVQLNKFTTDEIVSKRDSIEIAIESYLSKELKGENFQLEQLTSGLKYPETIVEAVNAKNKAIQDAQRALNEVKVAEANAQKMIVAARAEKEANELRSQALTSAILQKMWIEKWDGTVPTVISNGTSTFLDLRNLKK